MQVLSAVSSSDGAALPPLSKSAGAFQKGPGLVPAPSSGDPQRWVWLLGTDPELRRYLKGTLVSSLPYGMGMIIAAYCGYMGIISTAVAWALIGGRALTLAGFYAALRSGWARRFADPTLSLAQVAVGILWIATMYALTGPAHAAQLPLLVLTMTAATVNLNMRGARLCTFLAMILMTVCMLLMSHLHSDVYVPKVQFCFWVIMVSTLPTMLLNGIQLKRLRRRLKTEREELRQALTRLNDLATHDELTGLSNRAHMGEMLQQYLQRHEQEGQSFSVALLDLDYFKRVNDTHGHGVGDEVLKAFAEAMKKNLRESDLMARWGGEEFLLVFPQSTAECSLAVIERLRSNFAEQVVSPSVPTLRASFSAGLVMPVKGETQSKVLERADQALYAAKSAGRNRCCLG